MEDLLTTHYPKTNQSTKVAGLSNTDRRGWYLTRNFVKCKNATYMNKKIDKFIHNLFYKLRKKVQNLYQIRKILLGEKFKNQNKKLWNLNNCKRTLQTKLCHQANIWKLKQKTLEIKVLRTLIFFKAEENKDSWLNSNTNGRKRQNYLGMKSKLQSA